MHPSKFDIRYSIFIIPPFLTLPFKCAIFKVSGAFQLHLLKLTAMKKLLHIFWTGVLCTLLQPAFSQEKQVPFFPEQDIVTIEKNYAKKMSFFTEYEHFIEAKLYESLAGEYALEIFYLKDGELLKDRIIMTPEEKQAYLDNMLKMYAAQQTAGEEVTTAEIEVLSQRGRPAMLVVNTAAGLGYYGWAVPAAFGFEDTKAFVSTYMLVAGASFLIPYQLTKNLDVSPAQAYFTYYGQSRGVLHGWSLGELMTKNIDYDDYNGNWEAYDRDRDRKNQTLFAMGTLGSAASGFAAFKLADRWDYNVGDVSTLQMWGDVGTISGLLMSDIFDFYEKNNTDAIFGTLLLTSAGGMAVGKLFGDTKNYTLGDAIMYRSTILLSCFLPVTLVHYFEPDDFTPYATAGLLGIASGSFLGWKATHNKNFETSQAIFTALGEIAGGLFGLGLGYLIAPDNSDGKLIMTTTTLGAFAGYGLMYSSFSKRLMPEMNNVKLEMGVNPMGLMTNFSREIRPEYSQFSSLVSVKMTF